MPDANTAIKTKCSKIKFKDRSKNPVLGLVKDSDVAGCIEIVTTNNVYVTPWSDVDKIISTDIEFVGGAQ